jgi:hypothetical protein
VVTFINTQKDQSYSRILRGSVGGWKCPAIVVRDSKSGKELASYHCLFRFASAEQE